MERNWVSGRGCLTFHSIPFSLGHEMWDAALQRDKSDDLCRFPGCERPRGRLGGPGRRPAYCDDPAHNPKAAYLARQQAPGAAPEDEHVGPSAALRLVQRPAAAGSWRLRGIVEELRAITGEASASSDRWAATLAQAREAFALATDTEKLQAEARVAEERAVAAEASKAASELAREAAEQLAREAEESAEESSALAAESLAHAERAEAERVEMSQALARAGETTLAAEGRAEAAERFAAAAVSK